MLNIFRRAPKLKANQPIHHIPTPNVQAHQEILSQLQQLNAQRAKQLQDIDKTMDHLNHLARRNNNLLGR